jgi:uncharacterized membrane protein
MASHKSPFGLLPATSAALSYVLGPITGLIFLLSDEDQFVRFHAMQSIVFSVMAVVVNTALAITIVFSFLVPLLWVIEFILWLVAIYQASQYVSWSMPVVGKIARKLLPA